MLPQTNLEFAPTLGESPHWANVRRTVAATWAWMNGADMDGDGNFASES
ncbi:hypothetical protein APY04_3399 [Hyphomicrobium sulfonivorans]|uniref:Uncharacterized protein n=1 Tax=Hyphomicrobium sulfonivorans TaxID=121290 RepID=A0A125NTP6_HYPSL|nr:hypothetical protein APY04_3399 [Hyphomicrobium sulfonivorans]